MFKCEKGHEDDEAMKIGDDWYCLACYKEFIDKNVSRVKL